MCHSYQTFGFGIQNKTSLSVHLVSKHYMRVVRGNEVKWFVCPNIYLYVVYISSMIAV